MHCFGLTARDYFAAHAPDTPSLNDFPAIEAQGVEQGNFGGGNTRRIAMIREAETARMIRWRWHYADQMIAARGK